MLTMRTRINFTETFSFNKEQLNNDSGRLDVMGVAITTGITRNKVRYPANELARAAQAMKNIPILKDHLATTDTTVGLVTKAGFSNDTLSYEGFLTDANMIQKVKDGLVRHVSVGCMVENLTEDKDNKGVLIASGINVLELSLCPVPGCPSASIMAQNFENALCEAWNINHAMRTEDNNQEGYNMTENLNENNLPKGRVSSTTKESFDNVILEKASDGSLMFYHA